jgi:RNA polymerase sigma-70 factor (ECF subfamily)
VGRHLATLTRDAKAAKRDHRRARSIYVVIGTEEGRRVELADTLSEREAKSHRDVSQRSPQELAEMIMDMASSISDLPDENYREFCERLKYDSIAQVARDMDIPRTTLNGWITKIRSRFENGNLRDYL